LEKHRNELEILVGKVNVAERCKRVNSKSFVINNSDFYSSLLDDTIWRAHFLFRRYCPRVCRGSRRKRISFRPLWAFAKE